MRGPGSRRTGVRRVLTTAVALLALATPAAIARAQASGSDQLAEARAFVRAGNLEGALAAYTSLLEGTPDDLEARKERGRVLGWLGRHPEALADFDRVLAITPRDVEARIGRGRVLGYARRYAEAEAELRRALTDDPRAAEALLALGDILSWQERYADAARAYAEARAVAPQDPAPLLGLAKLRLWQDDLEGARTIYAAVLQLDPGNLDAIEGLRRIAAIPPPRRFRLDLGYRWETLSGGLSDWHQGTARLTVQVAKTTRLFVGLDQYRRFDFDDTQISLGGAQNLPGDVTLSGAFTYGIDAEVVARQVYEAEVGYRLTTWATPLLAYRHSNYPGGVRADIVTPGVELVWAPYLSVRARYYYAHSSNAGDGSAGSAQVTFIPEGPVSVYVGGAYGRETFLAGTVIQVVQAVNVVTVSAGVIWRITDWSGIRFDYAYEDRRGSYTKHGIGTTLFVEF
ncbi:MAG TPA: YaiO family outer membrane beta-barrel protein [Methylomirabilota bacterium]|nr:YaiO family outer membrane beta-barrel protein [Methylomirabilota bacterium]